METGTVKTVAAEPFSIKSPECSEDEPFTYSYSINPSGLTVIKGTTSSGDFGIKLTSLTDADQITGTFDVRVTGTLPNGL